MNLHYRDNVNERIMIVDDDGMFRESLAQNLSDVGFTIQCFADGPAALRHLTDAGPPDMILLDWKMPGMTGIEVLRELRDRNFETPVVFLTVLSDQIYEEAGLLGGAVDFIEKSRGFAILSRRIELILKGSKSNDALKPAQAQPDIATHGHVRLHRDVNRAFWKDVQVDLTLTEFQMVDYLVTRTGRDVRYRELYDIVHGEGFAAGQGEIGFRANVRAFIKRIRQKFRDVDSDFIQIENYPGFGYRWSDGDGA
ncbi:MAG TPA: response regulator transcription factor [Micropepsaceae bacterium]